MLLATYQPCIPDDSFRNEELGFFEEYLGWYPIWCLRANTLANFTFESWMCRPNMPERLLFFETEDYIEYDRHLLNRLIADSNLDQETFNQCLDSSGPWQETIVKQLPSTVIEVDLDDFYDDIREHCPYEKLLSAAIDQAEITLDKVCREFRRSMGALTDADRVCNKKVVLDMHLVKLIYQSVVGVELSLCDFAPIMPGLKDADAPQAWNDATFKCLDLIEIGGKGTEEDYVQVRKQYFDCCRGVYDKFIGRLDIGRNEPCPCGSGKKFKHCCMSFEKYSGVAHDSLAQPLAP